jgi:putative heme-binding domain-containing protein
MRRGRLIVLFLVGWITGWCMAQEPSVPPKRMPWTTSRVIGSPDPPSPYQTELAFPKLKFDEPLDLTSGPGSPRLFVTERFGRVLSFPVDRSIEKADLLIDLNPHFGKPPRTVLAYGFALHPRFAENGFVYITIVPNPEREEPRGTRVSRFKATGNPPVADPKSETVIIEWPNGGHNGGALEFGPDGFLYIATGDASGIADQYLTGQDMSTLAGKILRIDVDRSENGRNYAIPPDNPFVGQPNTRPEIWALGLRQPWKFSFDRKTGDLWCGNVGQDLWEQIYLIEKGGNYGWSVMEGSHPFRPERPRGPGPIQMPIVEHDHANFRSITGGFVYHGQRLPDLRGTYIYGDYDTGRIWAFRWDPAQRKVLDHRELYQSNLRLVDFAEDTTGELYLLDHMAGTISWLVPNPNAGQAQNFPRKLSETGLFSNTAEHRLAPGVIPYTVIAPQWLNGATKERFLGLPGTSQIEFEGMLYPFARNTPPGWKFPHNTVIAETIFLETDQGRRRVETRLLHHQRLTGKEEVGDQYWRAYTYLWNDDQTDAILVENPQGVDRIFRVPDPKMAGGFRSQTWHVPGRTECIACHNMAAKYAIGVQTAQMNTNNQLRLFEQMGLFTQPLPQPPEQLPELVPYVNSNFDINLRARSYLHANCGHCHRTWGGGNSEMQLIATWELAEMGLVNVRPAHGTFQIPNARLIAPGEPFRSVLFYRLNTQGSGRMPRLDCHVIDEVGARLIHDWISQLPRAGLITESLLQAEVEATDLIDRLDLYGPQEMANRLQRILSSTSLSLRLAYALSNSNLGGRSLDPKTRETIIQAGAQAELPEVRDLFERFLPEEKRIKRLGSIIRAEQILSLKGDVERGRRLFHEGAGLQCRNCHRIGGQGVAVGPDLDGIGKKYDAARILESIIDPSRQIDAQYVTYLLETKRGQTYQGLLVKRDDKMIVLKDAQNKLIEVPASDMEVLLPQAKSLMPELLLRDLTAEQVADLLAYLASLK